jgi:glycogen synthase
MNGLIEITMGGEVRTLKFGNYALMSYNVLTATDAGETKQLDIDYQMIDFVRDITYCGLKNYYKISKRTFDVSLDDVTNWIDDMDLSNIQTIIDAWTKSLESSQYIQNGFKAMASKEEDSKKK